jgi:hypothetical protein
LGRNQASLLIGERMSKTKEKDKLKEKVIVLAINQPNVDSAIILLFSVYVMMTM